MISAVQERLELAQKLCRAIDQVVGFQTELRSLAAPHEVIDAVANMAVSTHRWRLELFYTLNSGPTSEEPPSDSAP